MRIHPFRRLESAVDHMSPLQQVVTAALMTGDDRWDDEVLAERHGTTPDAIRIERGLVRRRLQDALAQARHR
jgi:hypothetical protein